MHHSSAGGRNGNKRTLNEKTTHEAFTQITSLNRNNTEPDWRGK